MKSYQKKIDGETYSAIATNSSFQPTCDRSQIQNENANRFLREVLTSSELENRCIRKIEFTCENNKPVWKLLIE